VRELRAFGAGRIEPQTALTELNCRNNALTALDLSASTALINIYCTNNALTSLLLPASDTVKRLECEKNLLTALDVTHMTQVTVLNCAVNALSSLDVSQNTKLMQLKVYSNAIKGAAMTALMNGLPTAASSNKLYVIDTAASPADGNVALVSDVAVATGKNWSVLDWKNGYEETYPGSVPTPDYVCEIGSTQYETLDAAIDAVPWNTSMTIKLLQNIAYTSTLTVSNAKKITLDLNGYSLTVTAAAGAALDVGYGGSLTTTGTGSLNLTGVDSGINAHDGGSADITGSVTATGNTQNHENGSGILADGSGSGVSVTVNGSVTGDMCGLNVYDGATVAVTENVTGHNVAVSADTGGEIHIGGSVAGSGIGVGADSATVEITGSVTATGSGGCGIFADKAAAVTVGAGVSAGQQGVSAANQSHVTVAGDIAVTNGADGGAAVIAETGSEVAVGGSVTGGAIGVSAETGGDIGVQENISGYYCGINVSESADVTVLGNVIADGTVGVGVNAYSAATATVDGAVSGHKAMTFGEADGALVTPTTKEGYLTYSDGGEYPSYVWLKENTVPVVETGEILDLTATGALVLGEAESGLDVTERGIVYAAAPDPTIETGTAVPATAAGAGEYDALLTGLSANTTYYVRAYATNALGTSYGACVSFTTPVAVSVVPAGSLPQNLAYNSASNKLYVANNIGNSVTVISGSTDAVLATIPVGKAPYHVAVNETTNRFYVPNNMDNTVSVIDGNTDAVIETVSVGSAPRASAVNEKTNKIYVVNYTAASVSVIDGSTNTVTATISVGSRPCAVAVNETTNRIYIVNYGPNSVSVINGATDTVIETVPVGNSPRHIAVNETTNRIYIVNYRGASVTVLNGADNSTQTVPLETNAYPWAAAVNKTTDKVYVTNSGTDTVTVISGDNTTVTIGAGKSPQAVAVNEATNAVYVGNYSADSRSRAGYIVTKIDGATNSIVGFACSKNPAELAVSTGENKTYVLTGNSVTVIDEACTPIPQPTTFVLSNEGGGLIDRLIAAGHGGESLYEVLQFLQPSLGGVIPDSFMSLLAACPADCEAKTVELSEVSPDVNNPIGINADGTLIVAQIFGRDYVGQTGYNTGSGYPEGVGEMWFTQAQSREYYIDAGTLVSPGGKTTYYKAFAIAWMPLTVTGTAIDNAVILQIDNRTPSVNDRSWTIGVTAGTLRGANGDDLTGDVTLSGLPAGLSYAAQKYDGSKILISLTETADAALTADASITAVIKGGAVTETGARDSAAISLALWYISPGTTFVLSNEGGLIDELIGSGNGSSNLFQTLVSIIGASNGAISERFMDTLASNPSGSEVFTVPLSSFAELNNPVCVNADGTLHIQPIFAADYYEEEGYSTYPEDSTTQLFTSADDEAYYIDAGECAAPGSAYSIYKAFAIAWSMPTLTVAGTAGDDTAILQIDNMTPSARDKTWVLDVTTGTVKTDISAADVTLTGLPAGLSYTAAKGDGNTIVITLTGTATDALTADAAITAVIKGSAVTETGVNDSTGIALDLWYIGPGTTFVISNESGGYLIDTLIAAGHGEDTLYETLEFLQPYSGGTITDRFLKTLRSCPADSEVFDGKEYSSSLVNFAGLNNPVGVNIDGTLGIQPIFGRDLYGKTGYTTSQSSLSGVGSAWFTYADSPTYYVDAGSRGKDAEQTIYYKVFAVAWIKKAAPPYIPPETGVLGATDYAAVVEKDLVQVTTLPVTVEEGSDTGVVVLDAALAAELFASPADIGILVPHISGVTSIRFDLPASALKNTPAASRLILDTPEGSVTLPGAMLKTIAGDAQKTIEITLGEGDIQKLSEAEKTAAGDRPLIALSLALDGEQSDWNDPSMPVTVTIPYTPTDAESAQFECLIIWRVDGTGAPVCIPNGRYDAPTGGMVFITSRFDLFACGFNKVTFSDVAEDIWYGVPVDFIAARLITTGAGGGKFSPDRNLTRAEYLVMLMRALELEPDENPQSNFADAGSAYYTGYLAAAKRHDIAAGVGDNRFAPDSVVTRQEMFAMLYNALQVTGQLPKRSSGKKLSDYPDADEIASWAGDAMTALVETGLVSGHDGRLFPTETSTRAEMAQVIYNLLVSGLF
jgi:YVTN family beta-propeller protein